MPLLFSFVLGHMAKGHFFAVAHGYLGKEAPTVTIRLAQVISRPADVRQAMAALPGLAKNMLN